MLHESLTLTHFIVAVSAVLLSYPLLYWFLRRVKRVPLRFNVTVLTAVVATGLLPIELMSFELSRSVSHLDSMAMIFGAEQRLNDMTLACYADPAKVSPKQSGTLRTRTRQRLVRGVATFWLYAEPDKPRNEGIRRQCAVIHREERRQDFREQREHLNVARLSLQTRCE